ncbi:MAG: GTP-binding protein [Candidatus Lokiarchaeota archaeon]
MNEKESEKKQYSLKIVIIGEPGVGKTSLVKRFVSNLFTKDYKASIGTNMYVKKLFLKEREITLAIWDIAGQEQWANMRHKYYRGSQGGFIVGDLSRKNTFEKIKTFWIEDLRKHCSDIPFLLIANKGDLNENVSKEDIEAISRSIRANNLIITSAKTGENVKSAFKIITQLIVEKNESKIVS